MPTAVIVSLFDQLWDQWECSWGLSWAKSSGDYCEVRLGSLRERHLEVHTKKREFVEKTARHSDEELLEDQEAAADYECQSQQELHWLPLERLGAAEAFARWSLRLASCPWPNRLRRVWQSRHAVPQVAGSCVHAHGLLLADDQELCLLSGRSEELW